jgi:prepilin-type N-terminal cleavage/methylation domain-containing protein
MDNQGARAEQRGFTLLEIMIVLALIGLLMSAVGVAIWKRFRDGQIKAAQLQVRDVAGEVGHFMVMKGKCPTVQEHERDPADVVSYGPDKRADTADDIRSWEL